MPANAVQVAVERAVGLAHGQVSWRPAAHSSFNETWRLTCGERAYFVKIAPAARLPALEAEAEGLAAIGATHTVRVPAVGAAGCAGGAAFLVLEWLDIRSGGHDAALGRALAALHRTSAPRFGWHRPNTIGSTPQDNAWTAEWAEFFVARRIAPQLALATRGGARWSESERLLTAIPKLLGAHRPPAALLHGDLWAGNAALTRAGEPVVFDPAVYYGDREADLAMTELFGGFGADFHAAYREAWPVDPGYAVRRTLYNLYHVLNHFNLFGGAYAGQAARMMRALIAQAG